MRILICNSVGKDSQGDNYILFPSRWSARVGKHKSFNFYPYELGYLSSLLKRETKNTVRMVDGNLENLNVEEYFEKYKFFRPDWLVMESSSVIYDEDKRLALKFKDKFKTKLVMVGQHASAFAKETLADGFDFVVVGEYEKAVLDLVNGKKKSDIGGLYPNKRGELIDVDWLPWPEDEDIARIDYSSIGGSDYREIEVFASRGCPMNCNFCVARQLYYGKSNFRRRKIEDVVAEIGYLSDKYKSMEGVFFDEEYHNADKKYVIDLCNKIVGSKLNRLKYDAMCGYWTIDKEMLAAMKEAGYYKLRIGIESVGESTGRGMQKNINKKRMIEVLKMAKKYGIKMYGTVTFGALGSTKKEDNQTLEFIDDMCRRGLLDDFQTSICTPQPGTPFFDQLDSKGWILTKDWKEYDGNTAVFEYPDYKKEEIEAFQPKAWLVLVRTMVKNGKMGKLIIREIRNAGMISLVTKIWRWVRVSLSVARSD